VQGSELACNEDERGNEVALKEVGLITDIGSDLEDNILFGYGENKTNKTKTNNTKTNKSKTNKTKTNKQPKPHSSLSSMPLTRAGPPTLNHAKKRNTDGKTGLQSGLAEIDVFNDVDE